MIDKTLAIGRLRFRATDGLILAALTVISLEAIVFSPRVAGWWLLVLQNLGFATAYVVFNFFSASGTNKYWKFFLRMTSIMFILSYINLAVAKLQLVIYGHWLDDTVLKLEKILFGGQPTLWLQPFISKPLTEWMMFAYVAYLPLYPIVCGIVFLRKGESASEDYFFTLGLSNIICDLCFMLFPVAGPIPYLSAQFTVPLDGYFWTWIGEGLRHHVQFVGGTIPSPHCANATVMWLMAYRYHRPSFWILLPLVLCLYVSTVYCRFHYVTDAILGIATGILIFVVSPSFVTLWNRLVSRKI